MSAHGDDASDDAQPEAIPPEGASVGDPRPGSAVDQETGPASDQGAPAPMSGRPEPVPPARPAGPPSSPAGPPPPDPDDPDDQLRRALADLDNLRKRFDREVRRERAAERARVLRELLPAVDGLERAVQHAEADPAATLTGLKAVLDKVVGLLEQLGFPRYEDVGAPFDPLRHEAVATIESDQPPGSVVEALRPGYGTSEEVLRPAGVVVARGPG
jgi:molecular chaperone GrpE